MLCTTNTKPPLPSFRNTHLVAKSRFRQAAGLFESSSFARLVGTARYARLVRHVQFDGFDKALPAGRYPSTRK